MMDLPGQTGAVPNSGRAPSVGAGVPSARGVGGTPGQTPGRMMPPPRSQSVPRFLEVGNFTVTGIPGYTGFVPGKLAENVMGTTFQRSNELAMHACESRAYPPKILGGRRSNPFGLGDRTGSDIVGYTGYIPGKYADNVFGHVFARSNHISQLLKQEQMQEKHERHVQLIAPSGGINPTEFMMSR